MPPPQSHLGPLGVIRGMTFDPVRNRYFPTPKDTPAQASAQASRPVALPPPRSRGTAGLPLTGCDTFRGNKRAKTQHQPTPREDGLVRPKTGRMAWRGTTHDSADRTFQRHYSDLNLQSAFVCGECHGEQITFLQSFNGGAFYAGTDHGKVIIHRQDGETHGIPVCASGLTWMHCDIPRMTMLAVAAGPEAHLHHFWRDPANLEHIYMQHSELNLPQGDIFSVSSYDDMCTLGGSKSLTTIHYTPSLRTTRRAVPSDVLALHQTDPNLLFCGFRNGAVGLEDMRLQPSRIINRVGGTRKQKAVVGVKRLNDGAVPWGLVVSGLGDELLLFDIRYPKESLYTFQGHINNYQTTLGLATSPDDKFLWAAGSDSRLRLYSTSSGQRIMPYPPSSSLATSAGSTMSGSRGTTGGDDQLFGRQIGPKEGNPLRRVFKGKVEHISVRPDDLGLDISVKGEIMRFSRMGQGRHQHRHQDPGGQGDEDQSESEISEESMDLDRAGGIRYELDDLD